MLSKFSINSFCKIDKTPFFETIFRKSKLDIYKCPFSKISVDFLTRFFKSGENLLLFFSLKTIKNQGTYGSPETPPLRKIFEKLI